MENFELLRNVTIGQYIPTGSIIHRLDPRAKIVAFILIVIAVSFNGSLLAHAFVLGIVIATALASRIPLTYMLRGLVLGLPLLLFIFVIQFLFAGNAEPAGRVYFEWNWFRITRYSLYLIALTLLRISEFIFLTSLITMTSTTTELTHGVEKLLDPFRRFGVPAHELALILTIALRFVPTLAEEAERIVKAQASRGADFSRARIWRPDKAARAYLPLVVPLFLGAFRRAEDLVLAMEARGYIAGAARTRYVELHSSLRDYIVVVLAAAILAAIYLVPWPPLHRLLTALTGLPF
jgi:energy-coupling factor transport system permease protein